MQIESWIRPRRVMMGLGATALLLLAWRPIASRLLEYEPFMSHGNCYMWRPNLIALHVISDSLITIAYFTIPFTLLRLVRKRKDLPFHWIFLAFGVFIVACGLTHLMEIWTVWRPVYWLSGAVKAVTAMASVVTAVALVKLVPVILMIPGVDDLKIAKEELEREVAERKETQARLQQARDDLERRVEERTTDLAGVNAELQRANTLKDQFLAMLSHEIRTPLTALYGWIYMLRNDNVDENTRTRALEVMDRNIKVQMRLVDDLLNVSRIVTGKLTIEPVWVDPVRIIESSIESIQTAADAKAIRIERRIDRNIGPIHADSARLQQVLWNLLTNAVKFVPPSGRITLMLSRSGSWIEMTVADTGKGIEPEFLPRVFERFSQADVSTTRKHGGLGLGLSIARYLVELHGGTIEASSAGRDQGATFIIRLPVPVFPSERVVTPSAERLAIMGVRVMVVEDDADTREMIVEALERHGASVLQASSGTEALIAITENKPDILISDIGMPEMDGYDLLTRIRLGELGLKNLPAIALTAYASVEDKEKARRAGFAAHLSKPISVADLVSCIARIVSAD
jgi:signal transduction histidine kinase/ActR/RegA family two-component response regulator